MHAAHRISINEGPRYSCVQGVVWLGEVAVSVILSALVPQPRAGHSSFPSDSRLANALYSWSAIFSGSMLKHACCTVLARYACSIALAACTTSQALGPRRSCLSSSTSLTSLSLSLSLKHSSLQPPAPSGSLRLCRRKVGFQEADPLGRTRSAPNSPRASPGPSPRPGGTPEITPPNSRGASPDRARVPGSHGISSDDR